MYHDVSVEAWHVLVWPCEHIVVVLEQVYQLFSNSRWQHGPDLYLFSFFFSPQVYSFCALLMRWYLPLILFNQSQQVRRQVIIFHTLFVTELTGINNPFEIDPLAVDRVILVFIVWIPASEWKRMWYRRAIYGKWKNAKMGHKWRFGQKVHHAIHFISWKDAHIKAKTLNAFGQEASGCSWSLLIMESKDNREFDGSPIVQHLSTWEGSLVSVALWSSNSTMSMLKLPNVFTITSSSLPWIISGLMNPAERNEELSGGMSIFMLFASFPRKPAILFYLFSSRNLCLACLLGLYPTPNLSFFWITVIGLNMPCSRFPNPFPALAPLPGTCLMPKWVTLDSFGMGTLALSFTYMALTNSRDLKEHSIAFSFAST